MHVPNRSLHQRMSALESANGVRIYRSHLKRDVKAGKISVITLLEDPPVEIENMKIGDLLMSVPKIGQTKTKRILMRCRISPSKNVGGLSSRQLDELKAALYF